jgi:type VII secretion protein EccB
MPSSRVDEIHASRFAMERVVKALTRHDPDPAGRPAPRHMVLTLASLMVTALIAVTVGIVNLITGQGTPDKLQNTSTVLIEKETGAQFVYTAGDGRLHPVLNFASALLLTSGGNPTTTVVRHGRLSTLRRESGVATGPTLGIADAPDTLPGTEDLLAEPWQVCTRAGAGLRTQLLIGRTAIAGGHTLAAATAAAAGEALLVQAPDRRVYLAFGDRKHLLADPPVALAAFGWTGRPRQPVAAAWLNALESGPDIATPVIEDLGKRSRAVQDSVGTLYRASGPSGDQWAVVRRDDVLPISPVQARLLRTDPDTSVEQIPLSVSAFAKLPFAAAAAAPAADGGPAAVPTLVSFASQVCARVAGAAPGAASILLDPERTAVAAAPPASVARSATGGGAGVDEVGVPAGRGVLVRSAASASAPASSGPLSIVTDAGVRYPIADRDALTKLGYGATAAQAVPAGIVALLPEGPALSAEAARKVW